MSSARTQLLSAFLIGKLNVTRLPLMNSATLLMRLLATFPGQARA